MAEVSITIHGRQYGITCDEGQEARVHQLAGFVDEKVRDMAAAGAANNDTQLLVLASILMADELFELREQMHDISVAHANGAPLPASASNFSPDEERQISETVEQLAERINGMADKLLSA